MRAFAFPQQLKSRMDLIVAENKIVECFGEHLKWNSLFTSVVELFLGDSNYDANDHDDSDEDQQKKKECHASIIAAYAS